MAYVLSSWCIVLWCNIARVTDGTPLISRTNLIWMPRFPRARLSGFFMTSSPFLHPFSIIGVLYLPRHLTYYRWQDRLNWRPSTGSSPLCSPLIMSRGKILVFISRTKQILIELQPSTSFVYFMMQLHCWFIVLLQSRRREAIWRNSPRPEAWPTIPNLQTSWSCRGGKF